MCTHFSQEGLPWSTVVEELSIQGDLLQSRDTTGHIYPGRPATVIYIDEDRRRVSSSMTFGITATWTGPKGGRRLLANARGESLAAKDSWRALWFSGRRCVIPAAEWFEPRPGAEKRAEWALRRRDAAVGAPCVSYLAGLYNEEAFALVTVVPPAALSAIHDRIPLNWRAQEAGDWLDPEATPYWIQQSLTCPFEASEVEWRPA